MRKRDRAPFISAQRERGALCCNKIQTEGRFFSSDTVCSSVELSFLFLRENVICCTK